MTNTWPGLTVPAPVAAADASEHHAPVTMRARTASRRTIATVVTRKPVPHSQDEPGGGVGLRHEREVRGRYLDDRRVRALGHEPLQRRRDRLVFRAEQVPARQ